MKRTERKDIKSRDRTKGKEKEKERKSRMME